MNELVLVLADVVRLVDDVPRDEDVKAGWAAFAVFILLILAVAVLGWSLKKQLSKAQAAEEAGVYGRDPEPEVEPSDEPENHSAS